MRHRFPAHAKQKRCRSGCCRIATALQNILLIFDLPIGMERAYSAILGRCKVLLPLFNQLIERYTQWLHAQHVMDQKQFAARSAAPRAK